MKDYEKILNIKTRGYYKTNSNKHFDYEATFYKDLVELFSNIKLKESDTLVDLGSGLGRVLFLSNHLFDNYAKGIELRSRLYKKSLKNLKNYNGNKSKVKFYNLNVLDYEISDEDNYFFFFNSFDIDILKEVVNNIYESINKNKREVYIILAYPFVEYVEFFLEDTNFVIDHIIETNDVLFKRNKFLILRK